MEDRSEDDSRPLSEGTSGGEGLGALSGVPPVRVDSTQHEGRHRSMALQEDQLEAIAQQMVARLQPHSVHEAAANGKKARAKGMKRRVPTPISSSEDSQVLAPPKKSKHLGKSHSKGHLHNRPRQGRKGQFFPDPWASDFSSSSESSYEEGELSGSEEDFSEESKRRLFPSEFFPKLMGKVIQTLKVQPQKDKPESRGNTSEPSKFFLQVSSSKFPSIPMPVAFRQII